MKNNYSRLVIIALITIIVFLYALTIKGYAAGLPAALQETVTGVVTDEQGMPLPGVTITVKGTNRGTSTNLDGEYKIAVDPQGVLVFSYIGFKAMEVSVDGRREINVRLVEEITALDEVQINAGYYNTTRRESTGNISRLTAEEIELQPVVSPLLALQGRMAGVEIIPGGDRPGAAPTVRIRGRNSLREEGNYPLYIVDGVPVNSIPIESNSLLGTTGIDPLKTLNLSNIQSIEVLKDADATAIYGSRGANGVVLITTKQGNYAEKGLNISAYTGASWMPGRVNLLNTEQYLEIRRKAFENDDLEPSEYDAYDLVLWDQNRFTDWQDFFFGGTSQVRDVNLSANGGNKNTSFRLSGSFHKQGTIYRGDNDYRKFTGGFNLNHYSPNEKLQLGFSMNYGLDDNSLQGNRDLSTVVFELPPNAPEVFNEDGSLNWNEWSEAGIDNPLAGYFNSSKITSHNLIADLSVIYRIVPGLKFKTNLGYNYFEGKEFLKRPKRSYDPATWEFISHSSSQLENSFNSWIVEPQLIYDLSFGIASLNTIIGASVQEKKSFQSGVTGEGYVTESIIGDLSAADKLLYGTSAESEYHYAAVFGRIGLNWEEKLFLNLTGRRDGSSRFGPGKRLANFWAIGGAWIFAEEGISNSNDFLSFGKIRTSYGTSGSDQIGDYMYMDAYEATLGQGGVYPTQLYNPDYSWEVNKKLEAAIDLGFLKDRLNLSFSWYRNRSSNQLVGFPLPAITGFSSVQANLPATVENKGFEVEVSSTNFRSKNFSWGTFFNLTIPKNELISYPGIEQSSYANVYKVGHPLSISLLYQYEGVDPERGLYTVADVNNDENLDYNDRIVIQYFGKQFYGGISNNLSYKNLSLQVLMDFTKQKGYFDLFEYGDLGNQASIDFIELEESGDYQRISQSYEASEAFSNVLFSNLPVVDASYLRLRSLSFAYDFPSSFMVPIGLSNAKIFLNGQNLYTITKFKGLDPEEPNGGRYFAGLRTITGGIQIQF